MKQTKKILEPDVIWPIRMKNGFKVKFKAHCDKYGYSMNKRVKLLMEQDMNKII